MSKLNLSKLNALKKTSKGADTVKSAEKKKQVSISRFFTPAKQQRLSDVIIDVDSSCSSNKERNGTEVEVPSPFRKRSHVSPSQEETSGNKRQRIQTETEISPISSHTQHKLNSFKSGMHQDPINSEMPVVNISHNSASLNPTQDSETVHTCGGQNLGQRLTNEEASGDRNEADSDEDFSNIVSSSKYNPHPSSQCENTPSSSLAERFKFGSHKGGKACAEEGKATSRMSPKEGPLRGVKYTPLELQFLEIKKQYPDALLFVECGYKYKFFGQDAEIAAKELNIFCHPDHNFMVASIPVHRLFVHTRRLVAKGHKVGVVKQTETAALKAAGDNRSAPFQRKLSALYTKSTLIGEDVDPVIGSLASDPTDGEVSSVVPSNYLLCLSEFTKPSSKARKNASVEFGVVAIQPATGDIIYDSFHDNDHLSELDTRIHHIQPVELLLPTVLTEKTEKLVQDIVSSSTTEDDRIRIERMDNEHFDYSEALDVVTAFYSLEDERDEEQETEKWKQRRDCANRKLQEVINLPVPVICCLAALLRYLKEFNLHRVLKMTSNLVSFSARNQCMKLDACALRNLEIFKNQTDGSGRGSLFWVLDHTKTRFGSRLLRKWLAMPLMELSNIQCRQDAVEELMHSDCEAMSRARDLLSKVPDLEKGICSIYHKKCSSAEFYTVVKSLSKLCHTLSSLQQLAKREMTSELLKVIFTETPSLLEGVNEFLLSINEKAAKDGNKTELFCDTSPFPGVERCQRSISEVLQKIQDHRREVRKVLRKPTLEYVTVSGMEFLIEVRNILIKEVPSNWVKISSTKQVTRFHSPFLVQAYKTLSQLREQLAVECQRAWLQFLDLFGDHYFAYRKAIQHLAALDCLFSMAELAQQEGYCRPVFNEDGPSIHIENGRHPVVDTLLGEQEQYVPNSTALQGSGQRCMIITGPNMGGKSSYIRQVALITIMAQIGCWVPAESVSLGVVDAIYTRMGASDNLAQHRSTFMVELQEASDILSRATPRSLVILDELGRGTSTHDGVAIALATARHFIQEVQCLLLFVTHYPPLAELERQFPDHVTNYHMSFLLHEDEKEKDDTVDIITFLYQLVPGMAARSYGLNVARLAEIPAEVIKMAAVKSHDLEEVVLATRAKRSSFVQLWGCSSENTKNTITNFCTSKQA
ncbi:DNA mismatch repair protein Msh3-like [Patiria miniata]|uniref:DNA mismatch repair protein MSH3 n=1 Tax=Patiria miniata TaxID=46514 RepID=A0A914BND9_PATMI|nr:DNA mismatch repair protein Msh3-like [Patiria miniata]